MNAIKAIKTYLAAEKAYAQTPATWAEALLNAAYEALVALAKAGDEDAEDFLIWKQVAF